MTTIKAMENEKINNYVESLKRYIDAAGLSAAFNIAHAYLQGLEDAGAITEKEHEAIFAYITGLD